MERRDFGARVYGHASETDAKLAATGGHSLVSLHLRLGFQLSDADLPALDGCVALAAVDVSCSRVSLAGEGRARGLVLVNLRVFDCIFCIVMYCI